HRQPDRGPHRRRHLPHGRTHTRPASGKFPHRRERKRRDARRRGGQPLLREAVAQDGILQRPFRYGADGAGRGPGGDCHRADGAQHLAGHAAARTTVEPSPHPEGGSIQGLAPSPPADRVAARLRGLGPLGILATLVILLVGNYPVAPLSGVLVLVWVWRSRTPWREIGYVRPQSWTRDLAMGIALGIA